MEGLAEIISDFFNSIDPTRTFGPLVERPLLRSALLPNRVRSAAFLLLRNAPQTAEAVMSFGCARRISGSDARSQPAASVALRSTREDWLVKTSLWQAKAKARQRFCWTEKRECEIL
jgi:hypothetical protein